MARRAADGMERESIWRQEIEARLRKLESASPGGFSADAETTFLRGGRNLEVIDGDIVIDGGQLVAGPTTVDASGVTIGPTTLNSSGVDIGPTSLSSTGLQVGSDVEIDASGLQVIGGFVTPIWVQRYGSSTLDASLTTSFQTVNSVVVSPPSWVQTAYLLIGHHARMSDATSRNLAARLDVGAGGFGTINFHVESGASPNSSGLQSTVAVTSFPTTVLQQANVSTGTNSTNAFTLSVMAFGLRDA